MRNTMKVTSTSTSTILGEFIKKLQEIFCTGLQLARQVEEGQAT